MEKRLFDRLKTFQLPLWIKRLAIPFARYTYENTAPSVAASTKASDRNIQVLMAMDKPCIVLFGNVLSKEECEELIALAQPRMKASQLLSDATLKLTTTKQRSSNGAFFKRGETPLIQRIEQRIAEITHCPLSKGESLHVLRYRVGEEYEPHYDFFPPERRGTPPMLKRGGQRTATFIMYLNTVEGDGETSFPKLNMKIKAVQGNALYFSYANSKNELDRMTFHGGSPVTSGEKWVVTKWMRQSDFP